jgi:hypothetical protein
MGYEGLWVKRGSTVALNRLLRCDKVLLKSGCKVLDSYVEWVCRVYPARESEVTINQSLN